MQHAGNPEEMLDLVNIRDEVVGVMSRSEVNVRRLKNYRVVLAFIQNDAGAFWIPRRMATEKLYPNALDFSVAGPVVSGESYEDALIKKARAEVGLELTAGDYVEIGRLSPLPDSVGAFQRVYVIRSNVTPAYDESEFQSSEWLQPSEIINRYYNGEIMKPDLPKVLTRCGLV